MAHLRKRTNAQRLVLSTCKQALYLLSYGHRVLMSTVVYHTTLKNTWVTTILSSEEIAQRTKS